MDKNYSIYKSLVQSFLNNKIKSSEFSEKFFDLYKNDNTQQSDKLGKILDRIFSIVDAYCEDPELRNEYDFDDEQLYSEILKISENF